VCALDFHDLPPGVVEVARVAFLDWIGAALAGSGEPSVRILMEVLPHGGGPAEATILPDASKGPALFAGLINGAASHATEMDDFHKTSMIHLGITVIPAVLALAEARRASGADFMTAVIAGFEAGIRVGEAVNPSHWEFWHPSGTCGTFAAVAGGGRLLGLTPEQMTFGFGLAGTQAAGLRFYGGMNKHLHPGKAAMNGLLAALLAERGFTGDERIFEGETGFCRATAKDFDLDKLTAALPFKAGNFRAVENSYKPYASCRHTHPAIDAALEIVTASPVQPNEIASIRCRTFAAATRLLTDPTVRDAASAKFSLPYCLAVAIKEKRVGLDSFSPSLLWDREVRALMERVRVEVDPAMDDAYPVLLPAEVEIVSRAGATWKARVDQPKGELENPMSVAEIVDKYRSLASRTAGDVPTQSILERVMKLERLADMSLMFEGLRAKGTNDAGVQDR
jgi:2-methylcitrate dehydratase PrpD